MELLRSHAVAGRLDAEELAARAEAAYTARTVGELAAVLSDLPRSRAFIPHDAERRKLTWRIPALGTISSAGTTAVVAHFDGGFRGLLDGVAAVPFWATIACGALLATTALAARLRATTRLRALRRATH